MKKVLIVDNYDSFSYNLYQYVGQFADEVNVVKNDAYTCEALQEIFVPTHVIISPGPGRPEDAGITCAVPLYFAGRAAVLGVCLGHQGICSAFGGTVGYAKSLMHGKADMAALKGDCPLFKGLPGCIRVARYHSLACTRLPQPLKVTARTDDGEIMAVQHIQYSIFGVQFHPESILTQYGREIIQNFLNISEV